MVCGEGRGGGGGWPHESSKVQIQAEKTPRLGSMFHKILSTFKQYTMIYIKYTLQAYINTYHIVVPHFICLPSKCSTPIVLQQSHPESCMWLQYIQHSLYHQHMLVLDMLCSIEHTRGLEVAGKLQLKIERGWHKSALKGNHLTNQNTLHWKKSPVCPPPKIPHIHKPLHKAEYPGLIQKHSILSDPSPYIFLYS